MIVRSAAIIPGLLLAGSAMAHPGDDFHPHAIDPVSPVFPAAAEFFGVNARCSMTFDVTEDGGTENICGVCATTAPAEGPAADQIAELFVQSGVVAVNQWRYAPEDTPFPQNTARFTFHMNGDSKKTLPEYPIPVPCESRPVS